jgi:OmpA-OmpF porin, OOP family
VRFSNLAIFLSLAGCLLYAQEPDAWDFIPGGKTLLYDDYTDMPRGAAPPHWKVRGAALRLTEGRLAATNGEETTLWPNITKWPDNFTIEMEVAVKAFESPITPSRSFDWIFQTADGNWTMHVRFDLDALNQCGVMMEIADPPENESHGCRMEKDKPNRFALWSQDGRVRVYVNGDRVLDLNQLKFKFDRVNLRIDGGQLPASLGPIRIAESAPDFSQTLVSSGRYVSHGILFDLNSDQIKPDSKPVLQQIADALTSQTSLKVLIEGHTDSTGDAVKNVDLSKRRAASVKEALVKLGIGSERLTTDGHGGAKPASGNDTPKGRADNRRVEFVKL